MSVPPAKWYVCKECGAKYQKPGSLGGHVTSQHRPVDADYIIQTAQARARMKKEKAKAP